MWAGGFPPAHRVPITHRMPARFNPPAGLVLVTAFDDRATFTRYVSDIAWETDVWIAAAPTHLIHFNGERFVGPY